MKWISVLMTLLTLGGCVAFSDNAYKVSAYGADGKALPVNMTAQGSAVYTMRNALCSNHRDATVVFTDAQTGKQLKPYKCGRGVLNMIP